VSLAAALIGLFAAAGAVNPPANVTLYRCADGQTVEAGYPDPQVAVLKLRDHSYTLGRVRSASGVRFVGYGVQWWTRGRTQARLARLKPGETLASEAGVLCRALR
jgi:membrane-bound inhibitor of C-type lysozyme